MKVTDTTFQVNERDDKVSSDNQTIVVFGVRRGGTTAVARIVQELGINIGSNLSNNLEDTDFRISRGLEAIRQTVDARNTEFASWGWKHPQPYKYLPDLIPQLRNPKFIFVTRDLTANALGIGTRENIPFEGAVENAQGLAKRGMSLIKAHEIPALFVSYEKLLVKTESSIQEIASFLEVTPKTARISEIALLISPGRYRQMAKKLSVRQKLIETVRLWAQD